MLSSLLIANRGEIACRIIRTCRRLGIRAVAVYSEADATALHVRMADEAIPIGAPAPSESYLRGDRIIAAARASGAEAIHPGYGFLSENATFARAVREAGLIFVGPDPESVERMGSKADAKALMQAAGVPVVPGYHGSEQTTQRLGDEAQRIGYPLMIKAAAGGGGKGMRIVREPAGFASALASCQREAQGAFGDARVILERYVETPRHIEFQVFGDRHGNLIHLGERECSAQRRYQKVLEETPSPFLDAERRARMGAAAIAAARAVDYVGAGTVEFIVGADGTFYFMEMNTRLQVEHPVTELVTGLDLVEWQLRVASGEPLPLTQRAVRWQGHAIELRLYAEDPARGFLPGSGRIERLRLPAEGPGLRIDAGVETGDTVSIHYDPMIAKLIVHAADRPAALAAMRRALAACDLRGPASNLGFLEALLDHPVVREARIDTGYLDAHLDEFLPRSEIADEAIAAAACLSLLDEEAQARRAAAAADPASPWALADGWRIAHVGRRRIVLTAGERRFDICAHGHAGNYVLDWDGRQCELRGARHGDGALHLRIDGRARRLAVDIDGTRLRIDQPGGRQVFERIAAYAFEGTASAGSERVQAPMPGRIVSVLVDEGQHVDADQELLVMEAMKMEITLRAPQAGQVSELNASTGDFVEADTLLLRVVPGASR